MTKNRRRKTKRQQSSSDSDVSSDDQSEYASASDSVTFHAPSSASEDAKHIQGFKDAVQKGNCSLCAYFNTEYPELDLIHERFENGDSALHVAVRNKKPQLILYLLTNGLSPNARNTKNGDTPLHSAVRAHAVKVVGILLQYNADTQITNHQRETPLSIASENGDADIHELLVLATNDSHSHLGKD